MYSCLGVVQHVKLLCCITASIEDDSFLPSRMVRQKLMETISEITVINENR